MSRQPDGSRARGPRRRLPDVPAVYQPLLVEVATRLDHAADVDDVGPVLLDTLVPTLADAAALDLADQTGALHGVSATPVAAEAGRPSAPDDGPAGDAPDDAPMTASSGPELYPTFTDTQLAEATRSPETRAWLRAVRPRSVLVGPLVARGRALGRLTLAAGPARRRYTDADVRSVEVVARRAAATIDYLQLAREVDAAPLVRDEFLGTVSHELRTPLNAILGWATMLRRGILTDGRQRDDALRTIERNATTLTRLVGDVLDASGMSSGHLALTAHPVAVRPIVEAAIAVMRHAAEAKRMRLEVDCPAGVDPRVLGDAARLHQVVWHVVANAIKFTPAGGAVHLTLEQTPTEARVIVSDTGLGITSGLLPYIFQRFRQADSSTARHYEGLGLGLALVKHLVELHGGRITAQSAGRGHGATFTIHLPRLATPTASTTR